MSSLDIVNKKIQNDCYIVRNTLIILFQEISSQNTLRRIESNLNDILKKFF